MGGKEGGERRRSFEDEYANNEMTATRVQYKVGSIEVAFSTYNQWLFSSVKLRLTSFKRR
jgi:hypothetical protein